HISAGRLFYRGADVVRACPSTLGRTTTVPVVRFIARRDAGADSSVLKCGALKALRSGPPRHPANLAKSSQKESAGQMCDWRPVLFAAMVLRVLRLCRYTHDW